MAGSVDPYVAYLSTVLILKMHIYCHQVVFLGLEFLAVLLFAALTVLP